MLKIRLNLILLLLIMFFIYLKLLYKNWGRWPNEQNLKIDAFPVPKGLQLKGQSTYSN